MPHSIIGDGLRGIEIKCYRSWSHSGACREALQIVRICSLTPLAPRQDKGVCCHPVRLLVRALGFMLRVLASRLSKTRVGGFYRPSHYFKLFRLGRTKIEHSQLSLGSSFRFCTAAGLLHRIFTISYKSERSRGLNSEGLCWCEKQEDVLVDERRPCYRQSSQCDLEDHIRRDLWLRLHLLQWFDAHAGKGRGPVNEPMGEVVAIGSADTKFNANDSRGCFFRSYAASASCVTRACSLLCDSSNPNAEIARKEMGQSPADLFAYSHMLDAFAENKF
jgi:hypothetical protein